MEDTESRPPSAPAWGIAEAKQSFSEVVRAAQEEPQMIFNRDRQVAAVIGGEALAGFLGWRQRQGRSVATAFGELRRLADDEGVELTEILGDLPARRDRPDPWSE